MFNGKGFRGMKVSYRSEEFGEADESLLPKLYKNYLQEVKKDYKDRVMRPSKYGPLKQDIQIANLFYNEKERGWKRSNTKQYKDFRFPADSTYRFEQTMKETFRRQTMSTTSQFNKGI